ncbi:hypothetical protein HDU67_001262 [Dinochytrium kinnereticum]|nr:hypothetical protein HDU67_001262 [Dinochytrium kinnereticum]
MLSAGPSGFYNAPVSKAIFLTVGLNSLICSILNYKSILHLQIFPHVTTHFQIWRFFTTNLGFGFTRAAAGPYGLIFGALYQYHLDVPVTVRVKILGLGLSDKVFLYIISTQPLFMSSSPSSRERDPRTVGRGAVPGGSRGPSATVEPPEEAIDTLVGLGFERDQVLTALRVSGNDIDRAAAYLFDRAGR